MGQLIHPTIISARLIQRLVRAGLGPPPTSLSLIGHFRELRKIGAVARDLPSHADPERGVVGANRPNFANPLCARFPYVRPRAIGGVPIRGSEGSGAGLFALLSATKSAESASHLAASEQCVLRTAGTPK